MGYSNDTLIGLEWNKEKVSEVCKGDTEKLVCLTDPNEFVIGIGSSASKKEATEIGLRVYHTKSGQQYWRISTGNDGGSTTLDAYDFESEEFLSEGIVTGCGFAANDGKVKKTGIWFQNVYNGKLQEGLDRKGNGKGDLQEHYKPDEDNNKVIVGVGFRIKSEKVRSIRVLAAPLK